MDSIISASMPWVDEHPEIVLACACVYAGLGALALTLACLSGKQGTSRRAFTTTLALASIYNIFYATDLVLLYVTTLNLVVDNRYILQYASDLLEVLVIAWFCATIFYILFGWIELYKTFTTLKKSTRNWTKVRIALMVIAGLWVIVTYGGATVAQIVTRAQTPDTKLASGIGIGVMALFPIVMIIVAFIYWNRLYKLVVACIRGSTSSGRLFVDMTVVSVLSIVCLLATSTYLIVSFNVTSKADPFSLILFACLRLAPDWALWFSVCYLSSPFRKHYWKKKRSVMEKHTNLSRNNSTNSVSPHPAPPVGPSPLSISSSSASSVSHNAPTTLTRSDTRDSMLSSSAVSSSQSQPVTPSNSDTSLDMSDHMILHVAPTTWR
eukprot:TRINITY_DN2361_c0_g1_i5.p1 TRINITY_DN2361_c0_g1~~TRINITY_DN2361_c0_g1_i5.p1  ORF type:complete len:416 (-),score=57.00 TRINITY_DN2361_c0_g1_i5:121-1260(-)